MQKRIVFSLLSLLFFENNTMAVMPIRMTPDRPACYDRVTGVLVSMSWADAHPGSVYCTNRSLSSSEPSDESKEVVPSVTKNSDSSEPKDDPDNTAKSFSGTVFDQANPGGGSYRKCAFTDSDGNPTGGECMCGERIGGIACRCLVTSCTFGLQTGDVIEVLSVDHPYEGK